MSLTDSPAEILASLLIAGGIFVDPSASGNWPLYIGHMPDGPDAEDQLAAIYDRDGVKDGRLLAGSNVFHHGVQILVRSSTYGAGWAKAEAAAADLEAVNGDSVTIGSASYSIANVSQSSPVLAIGQEEGTKRRDLFSINFVVTLKEV